MKCPKCSYVSHDYLDACRKCGMDLVDFKKELHLQVVRPGDLDLSIMLSEHIEEIGATTEFGVDKTFFGTQMLIEPEEAAAGREEGFDISLDDEFPRLPAEAVSPLEGSVDIPEVDDFAALDKAENDVRPSGSTVVKRAAPASPSVDLIDMSDLENLDDVVLELPEDAPGDVVEAPPEPQPATEFRPTVTLDLAMFASNAAPELEDVALVLPETPASEALPAPPPTEPPEIVPTLATDDPPETEIELEVETEPAPPAASAPQPEAALEIDLEELELDDDEKNA